MNIPPNRHRIRTAYRLWHGVRAYVAHADPAAATANFVAMIVGWNTPFYPIYVIAFAGWGTLAAVLTGLAAPLFLAVPAIARASSRAGRFALPLIGIANTLWCTKVLGPSCGLELFLLPCAMLTGLLYRRSEKPYLIVAASFAFAANFLPSGVYGAPIVVLSAETAQRLATLNEASALTLALVIAWQIAGLLRMPE